MRFEQRVLHPDDLRQWLAVVGAFLLIGLSVAVLNGCGVKVCLFHRLTGLPCLTCGGTRALSLLTSGNVACALVLQPLVVVGTVCMGTIFAVYSGFLFVRRRVIVMRFGPGERRAAWVTLIVLAVLNWLYLIWRGV